MNIFRGLLLALAVCLPLTASAQREKLAPEDLEIVENEWPHAQRSFTGLRWVVLKEGTGDLIKEGDKVQVLYVGKLIDGKVFDKSTNPEQPFTFRVGRHEVIEGWEEALQRMRLGAKHVVIVPFELGYGSPGNPPKIPRRATLVFEVEVVGVERPEK